MTEPYRHRLRADRLSPRRPTEVDLRPDAAERARIAAALGASALPRARLSGRLGPAPGGAWAFDGRIEAEAVQPCGITMAPVTTVIAEDLRRVWSPHADPAAAEAAETEMGDDETEPLGAEIDLGAVLVEALALALPAFPRAPGATLEAAADEAEDEARRPFAGLADLLGKDDPSR